MQHIECFAEDLSNWMCRLPAHLKTMPIIHLAIPGSHDSGTWTINKHSQFAPDLDASVKKLRWLGCITKRIMSRWSKSQDYNITRQLAIGVRYLDIRIATKINGDNREFYIVHGLYGPKLVDVLNEIVDFLTAHPKEVIIFDCQHFYDVDALDHERLRLVIMEYFLDRLVPGCNTYIKHLTIDYMNGNNYQVIVIYRHSAGIYDFFPSASYPTPWPDTTNPNKLTKILTRNLQHRNANFGYVSQFVLTPKWTTVLRRIWTGTLKNFSGITLLEEKLGWVQSLSPGSHGVNVVIADFVDIFDQDFCRSVINLNKKLIDSPDVFIKKQHLPPITN